MVPSPVPGFEELSAETRADRSQILSRIIAGSAIKAEGLPAGSKGPSGDEADEAVAVLCRLLKDPDSEVRAAAAEGLGEGAGRAAPRELIAAAADPDRNVRLAVAKAMLRGTDPMIPRPRAFSCPGCRPVPVADRFQILRIIQGTGQKMRDLAAPALAGAMTHVDAAVLPDLIACLGESGPSAALCSSDRDKLLDDPEPGTCATLRWPFWQSTRSPLRESSRPCLR